MYKKIMPCIDIPTITSAKVRIEEKLTFPKYDTPIVSIIIPVYNQYFYTMQCLKSILIAKDPISYEIIVADDHSTDKTKEITKYVSNIKISRNEKNLGYIQNVNKAVKLAKGKYVYFLNNDTLVQKNWLSELVRVFDLRKDAGVVGSKIYNKDFSLQECGVLMFSDGFVNHFSVNPKDSRHIYLKQVDYVSGCSLLTTKKLFDEIGGFNILYSPAYCDDPDYCLEALKRGYKTYVQPKSQIIHFGSITYDNAATDLKNRNIQLLYKKWKNFFDTRDVSYATPDCSSIKKRPTILVIDHVLPQFDKHAGGKSTFNLCQMFIKMNLNVKFCPFFGNKEEPYYSILSDMGIEIIDNNDVEKWIHHNFYRLDYVLLSRPQVAGHFLMKSIIAKNIKVLYYGQDLHHLRMTREQEIKNVDNNQEIKMMKQLERLIIKCVNWAYYPSKIEENYIKKNLGLSNVSTIPVLLYDSSTMPAHQSFDLSHNIVFVGSVHGPNKDGLIWFIDTIFPKILKEIPNMVLNIVGDLPDYEIKKRSNENIKLLGYLTEEELSALYASSKLSIAPLRFGAGIKGKVVDAIYHNVPVVTTDIGAEGLDLSSGCISVGNTESEFAQLVIDLYTHEHIWNNHLKGCQDFISKSFSFEKAIEIFSKQIT